MEESLLPLPLLWLLGQDTLTVADGPMKKKLLVFQLGKLSDWQGANSSSWDVGSP